MSEILSQEEIDALLRGNSSAADNKMEVIAEEKEALSEICNISINVISNFLLSRLKKKVSINVKNLAYVDDDEVSSFSVPLQAFSVELKDCIADKTYFAFKMEDIKIINDLLIGGDGAQPEELDGDHTDILLEILKDIIPDFVASISSIVNNPITSSPLESFALGEENSNLLDLINSRKMINVTYDLEIGNVVKSQMYQLIPVSVSKKLVRLLLNTMDTDEDEEQQQQPKQKIKQSKKTEKNSSVTVKPVAFPSFDNDDESTSYDENIDFILDVPLNISVELGRTSKSIKEILNFNIGSIIELNNLAEDYVDVLVNGKLIARGEVIVIDENFGVRIMELYTNQSDIFSKG